VLGRVLDVEILHDSPKKASQFPGRCNDGQLSWLFGIDAVEELKEAVLSLPGVSDDVRWLALLAFLELSRDGRPIPVFPGSLNEHMATATVAGFGDGALSHTIPSGVFGRNESEEGHELGRALKASPVTDFSNEGHGGQGADAPKTAQSLDKGFVGGGKGDGFDLGVEVVAAAGLVVEECEVLGEDSTILWGEGTGFQETLKPLPVDLTPVTRLPEDQATAAQELEDVVARAEDFALEALTAAHQVSDPFFGR
jgi:hypothetical protein